MEILHFIFNVGMAALMGVAIGLERQIQQHVAGLRTNALVCVGARPPFEIVTIATELERAIMHSDANMLQDPLPDSPMTWAGTAL